MKAKPQTNQIIILSDGRQAIIRKVLKAGTIDVEVISGCIRKGQWLRISGLGF